MEKFNLYTFLDKFVVKSPFLKFLDPFMEWLNSGKIFKQPFSILYIILGLAFLLFIPFDFIISAINLFKYLGAMDIILSFIIFFILLAAGIPAFRYWIERSSEIVKLTKDTDEYTATPVISHLIKSLGECGGIYIALVGTVTILICRLFNSDISAILFNGVNLLELLLGCFVFIILSRMIAELLSAICSIANNTKK